MRRPLFLCLIGLVLGEAAAISMGRKGGLISVLIFWMAGLFLWNRSKKQSRFFLLFLVFLVIGFVNFLSAEEKYQENVFWEGEAVFGTLSGRIVSLKLGGDGNYEIAADHLTFISGDKSGPIHLEGKCRINGIEQKYITLFPDDRIQCRGNLRDIDGPTNPGEFDAKTYYRSRGIGLQLQGEKCQVCTRRKLSFRKAAYCLREKIGAVFQTVMSEEQAALLRAMILGEKGDLSEEQRSLYEENGVAHLLAVSGLHVSIVGGKIFRIVRNRGFSYGISCMSGGLLLLFYGCVAGFGHSVIRAVFMYLFYLGAEYFGAQYDLISAMSLSGILMLFEEPWRILEGGFQISFLSILSIGLVLPWVKKLTAKRSRRVEGELTMASPQLQRIKDGFLASLIISGTTLPFILHHFYQWSPYSILLNLLVLSCMTPLMLGGLTCGLSGMISLKAAFVLKLLPCGILELFRLILEKFGSFPGALIVTGCPNVFQMVGIYLFELILLILWYYRRWWKMAVTLVACFCLFCFRPSSELRITMLDVGQGESMFFQMPDGNNLLLDGGSISRSKVGTYIILPAIKYYGAAALDYVIITHMDEDHMSGIAEILEQGYPVKHLILPALKQSDESMHKLCTLAEENNTEVVFMKRGEHLTFGKTELHCLHPFDEFAGEDGNASSLVFYLKYGKFDGIFTGDLEETGEKAVCNYLKKTGLSASFTSGNLEVLKVAHHGSKYSTGQEFLHQLRPKTALISVGRKNRYGHPHREVLQRLSEAGCEVFETRNGGAIIMKTDGITWEIDSYR